MRAVQNMSRVKSQYLPRLPQYDDSQGFLLKMFKLGQVGRQTL